MKKYSNDNVRKINRTSRVSYSIIIPKWMIKKLGWKERQKLKFKLRGNKITIEDF